MASLYFLPTKNEVISQIIEIPIAKIESILIKAKESFVLAKILNVDPAVLDKDLPKDSIQAFDLNLIVFVVGIYRISLTGALKP